MKFRLTVFFVFQVLVWTTYFNWNAGTNDPGADNKAEKIVKVQETSTNQFASYETNNELYHLILRNDGFFTKINNDQSVENGLWTVNHNIPSLVLKLPTGHHKYRILEDTQGDLQVELINPQELIQAKKEEEKELKLFSSVK